MNVAKLSTILLQVFDLNGHKTVKWFYFLEIQDFFARFFIFVNRVKRHICNIKKLGLEHDLLISVNESHLVGILFSQICENKTITKISELKVQHTVPKVTKPPFH